MRAGVLDHLSDCTKCMITMSDALVAIARHRDFTIAERKRIAALPK